MTDEAAPPPDPLVREWLRARFAGRPTLRFAETAKLLNVDPKTLRRLMDQGSLPFRITGAGRRRLRREVTLSDLESFYANATIRSAPGATARAIARGRPRLRVRGSFLATCAKAQQS